MKSFKQHLVEMPTLLSVSISSSKEQPKDWKADSRDEEGFSKISTTPSGHDVYRRTKERKFGGDDELVTFKAVKDGKQHMHVSTTKVGENSYRVHDLSANEGNTIKAHELYHHLVSHHGIELQSDVQQSPGGMKTWERLSKKPGIKMTSMGSDGQHNDIDRHDFKNNYFRTTGPEQEDVAGREHRSSRLIARKAD